MDVPWLAPESQERAPRIEEGFRADRDAARRDDRPRDVCGLGHLEPTTLDCSVRYVVPADLPGLDLKPELIAQVALETADGHLEITLVVSEKPYVVGVPDLVVDERPSRPTPLFVQVLDEAMSSTTFSRT